MKATHRYLNDDGLNYDARTSLPGDEMAVPRKGGIRETGFCYEAWGRSLAWYDTRLRTRGNGMVSVRSVRRIGAASLIVPSLDHLISPSLTIVFAPVIMETMFGPGWMAATVFFILLGLFQLIWIGVLLKSNNSSFLTVGIFGNLVSILIYFVSTCGVTIFGVPPQPLIPFGVFIKALEAIFVLASLFLLRNRANIGTSAR